MVAFYGVLEWNVSYGLGWVFKVMLAHCEMRRLDDMLGRLDVFLGPRKSDGKPSEGLTVK